MKSLPNTIPDRDEAEADGISFLQWCHGRTLGRPSLNNGIWYVGDDGRWCLELNRQPAVSDLPHTDESSEVARCRTRRAHLNCASLSELKSNLHMLTPLQQNLLLTTFNRIGAYPQRFAREHQHYAESAGLILMSDLERRKDFCMCSVCGRRCNLWKLCAHCCHQKRMVILKKFLPVFPQNNWHFMSVSFADVLPFESPNTEIIDLYWAAISYAVRVMVQEGYLSGGFIFETLSVYRYLPSQQVLPHDHIVIAADSMPMSTIKTLRELVQSFAGQIWDRTKRHFSPPEPSLAGCIRVPVSTRTYPIEAIEDCCNILSYLVTPIDFVTKYRETWTAFVANDRRNAVWLNQNVKDVITGWELFSQNRDGHVYRGTLHHSSGGFAGIPKRKRETRQHDRYVRTLLSECSDLNLAAFPYSEKTSIEEQAGCP